jgi:hypothetical protein
MVAVSGSEPGAENGGGGYGDRRGVGHRNHTYFGARPDRLRWMLRAELKSAGPPDSSREISTPVNYRFAEGIRSFDQRR